MKQYNAGQKSDQGHKIEEDRCPVCGHQALNYGTLEPQDGMIWYPWDCKKCKSDGKEWYNLSFSGHNVETETDGT